MFQLKLWSAKGESYHPAFVDNWPTIVLTFLALPHIVIGWVLLQRNENMGSVQHFIFLFLCMLQIKSIRRQRSPRFPTPNVESFSTDLLLAIKTY